MHKHLRTEIFSKYHCLAFNATSKDKEKILSSCSSNCLGHYWYRELIRSLNYSITQMYVKFPFSVLESVNSKIFKKKILADYTHLSVSSSISKVRNHSCDILGWRSPTRIYHYQKLHEIFICWRTGGLHQINITSSNTLLQLNINFTISKSLYVDLSQFHAHVASNFLGNNNT